MYTVALFITMAILLEAVMAVIHSVLGTIGLSDTIGKIPVVGAHLTLIISILMIWVIGSKGYVLAGWGFDHGDAWVDIVLETGAFSGSNRP